MSKDLLRPGFVLALLLPLAVLPSCSPTGPAGSGGGADTGAVTDPPDPARLVEQPFAFDSTDFIHLHVKYPAGGETFRVGDTVPVMVFSEDAETYSPWDIDLALSLDNGRSFYSYGTDADEFGSMGAKGDHSVYFWVVPDSIYDEGLGAYVAVESDSCLYKVVSYQDVNDFSVMPTTFRIVRRP